MFSRCEARRSASKAWISGQPHWAMMMPLACSITGMDASRAYAEYRSRSAPGEHPQRRRLERDNGPARKTCFLIVSRN
jgi:hypothetical protein